jgi:hypothetical protein
MEAVGQLTEGGDFALSHKNEREKQPEALCGDTEVPYSVSSLDAERLPAAPVVFLASGAEDSSAAYMFVIEDGTFLVTIQKAMQDQCANQMAVRTVAELQGSQYGIELFLGTVISFEVMLHGFSTEREGLYSIAGG